MIFYYKYQEVFFEKNLIRSALEKYISNSWKNLERKKCSKSGTLYIMNLFSETRNLPDFLVRAAQ